MNPWSNCQTHHWCSGSWPPPCAQEYPVSCDESMQQLPKDEGIDTSSDLNLVQHLSDIIFRPSDAARFHLRLTRCWVMLWFRSGRRSPWTPSTTLSWNLSVLLIQDRCQVLNGSSSVAKWIDFVNYFITTEWSQDHIGLNNSEKKNYATNSSFTMDTQGCPKPSADMWEPVRWTTISAAPFWAAQPR